MALLTEHFPFLTKNQLVLLGKNHAVDFVSGAQKEVYRHLLRFHKCTEQCTRTPLVFKQRAHARADLSKWCFPSAQVLADHPRQIIESRRQT